MRHGVHAKWPLATGYSSTADKAMNEDICILNAFISPSALTTSIFDYRNAYISYICHKWHGTITGNYGNYS